jgi:bifunctional ADP-heptose synthase (sugar kinase/adenylyltransferase)
MNAEQILSITGRYADLRIAVVGDFFLDRYLLIDPAKGEISIETGLPVYNVVGVRSQPGAAGTILNNLVALGIGEIHAVGFCGDDGEGYELRRALASCRGVRTDHFLTAPDCRTPVYCKPLVIEPGEPPRELNRFDSKNWVPTPETLQRELADRVLSLSVPGRLDALILMDQVDLPETGVATRLVSHAARQALESHPKLITMADSRRGLHDFPALGFKMNAAELARMTGADPLANAQLPAIDAVCDQAMALSARNGQPVFVTLAEQGIVAAWPGQPAVHVPSLPVRGPIDIVGAGDSVTANLVAALAAGAAPEQALQIAMAAASIVIHQLGTTGTASPEQIADLMRAGAAGSQ